jgi:hypothetical protein
MAARFRSNSRRSLFGRTAIGDPIACYQQVRPDRSEVRALSEPLHILSRVSVEANNRYLERQRKPSYFSDVY